MNCIFTKQSLHFCTQRVTSGTLQKHKKHGAAQCGLLLHIYQLSTSGSICGGHTTSAKTVCHYGKYFPSLNLNQQSPELCVKCPQGKQRS